MGMDAKAGFVGLVTAVGEVAAAQGALRIADNVTLRREGAISLRSFFGSTALSRTYAAAFPYRDVLLFMTAANRVYDATQTLFTQDATDQLKFGDPYPAIRADVQSAKEARGNFYVASATGVFKLTSTTSAMFGTGMPIPYIAQASLNSTAPTLLTANQRVAYRIVQKYTDPNGLVLRSRPSGAYLVDSGATAGSPSLAIASRYAAGMNYQVEVYRTRIFPNTASVDDEMQLVATLTPTGNTTPNNVYTDRVSDASRTTTLYTSPSRGGIENANDRPPGCACLERYRGCLFFGNTRGPSRITISFTTSGDLTGSATGIGARQATASWTSGTNTMTVNSATGLQVGMQVYVPTTPYFWTSSPAASITAIAGTTLTLDQTATSTRSGVAIYVYDTFSYREPTTGIWRGGYLLPMSPSVGPVSGGATLAYSINYGSVSTYDLTPAAPGYQYTAVIESGPRGPSQLAVRATHGDEYNPPLALHTSSTGTLATYDDIPNGLSWSEPDQPEHCPPKNFARVGDTGKAILALVATRDRLLILKEDGVFMLTGDTARNFAIYPLDTTCLCILPGSVRRLQNTVYFLSNLGLVAIDENGSVSVVGRAIQTELAPIITQIRQTQKTSGTYLMPGLSGVTGTSDDANGEYWMLLGSTTPSFGGQALIYNAFREGFTTYSFGTPAPVAVAADGEGQPLVLTASSMLTPSTSLGAITARVSPHAFSDPALVGKLWTHIVAGFSRLTGTTSVSAKFSSSESQVDGTSITETIPLPTLSGLVELPGGSLVRHPVPQAMKRGFLTFIELVVAVSTGTFVLELIGAESRENAPNKQPSHGSGAT